jgi:hypothetical protein
MDFFKIKTRPPKKGGELVIYPDFLVARSKDLMIRGKNFYAVWDADRGLWSTDEYDVRRLVDEDLLEYKKKYVGEGNHSDVKVNYMKDFSTNSWSQFKTFLSHMSDNAHELDSTLTFADQEITKDDYVSKRLPYPLKQGLTDAWELLISTLYNPEERAKIEWAIGAVISGESKNIQKFLVLYGEAGGGKSTILNIIQKLFEGYYTTFESKALGSNGNSFATEAFRGNPLVAIEHDGDLSRIEDNTKLNSLVAHEEMLMNEKYKPTHSSKSNSFIFIGTNKPVKITDGKSGIIRRLIDVRTSGRKLPVREYLNLMSQIDFELGGIAHHCLEVYRKMGRNYYSGYRPVDMMLETDVFYNFMEANYYIFKQEDGVTLARAWEIYKTYCDEALIEHRLPRHKFREELKIYFKEFKEKVRFEGQEQRSVFLGFKEEKFISNQEQPVEEDKPISLILDSTKSLLDTLCSEYQAQYADNVTQFPKQKWKFVETHLSDINTSLLHYVILPENHIVIDFDLADENGEKSQILNLEAASMWPPTYAEYSKSQKGIHLHYFYDGDVSKLASHYSDGIEIKRTTYGDLGPSSLRRKFSFGNNIPIARINSGLPLKGEKVINIQNIASEKALVDLIQRNLNKEIHPGTKPSIDFIHKILEDAYKDGLKYDVTPLRPKILNFASRSSHQSQYCVGLVSKMKFKSEEKEAEPTVNDNNTDDLVFYDLEVFPNLLLICWKYRGKDKPCVRMINPSPQEIEGLFKMKLVGFNCRRYDNHILYGRYLGYDNLQLFELSGRIVNGSQNAYFREAFDISYADIYDFSSKKQSLKAFQVELGIEHKELGLAWDQPVPEELWHVVADYCDNDVTSEEEVFDDRKQDFVARQILAELSGLSINDSTQSHTARILFGNDPRPFDKFVYTDLSETFPGYTFDNGVSSYKGEDPKEGGYVYAQPGMYENVALLDVASMHPTSILQMNMFGPYTKRYKELLDARLAIKHRDYATARTLLGGMLAKYLDDPKEADDLAYALKIHALNIVYGLTAASFQNKFRDPRNIDNIVAKRGALFMIDLKHAVEEQGFVVAHIKTDSIKIPNATQEIIEFVHEFGRKYGYTFEHEATYDKMCLVNNAVYIARYGDGKKKGTWSAVGAEFAHPYVYKKLFSNEDIEFRDLCETKAVTSNSAIYLDFNEELEDVSIHEKELHERTREIRESETGEKRKTNPKLKSLTNENLIQIIEKGHNYHFVGKVGSFVPMLPGSNGGILVRLKDGKYYAVTGTKGYRWMEASLVKELGLEDKIDYSYFQSLLDDAKLHISEFGDFDTFTQ